MVALYSTLIKEFLALAVLEMQLFLCVDKVKHYVLMQSSGVQQEAFNVIVLNRAKFEATPDKCDKRHTEMKQSNHSQ